MPGWHARLRLLAVVRGHDEGAVLLCTDAAGTRMVWGWTRVSSVAPPLYVEEHRTAQDEPSGLMPWWEVEGVRPRPGPPAPLALAGCSAAAEALLGTVRHSPVWGRRFRSRRAEAAADTLLRVLAGSHDPAVVRWVWRRIRDFRVLDPHCEGGEWLVGAVEVLATIALGCLERMQGWVMDVTTSSAGVRRRPFPDFRRVLGHRAELASCGGRERLAYESVLLRCIHGLALDRAGAAEAIRKVAARVPGAAARLASPLCDSLIDIRAGRLVDADRLRFPIEASAGAAMGLEGNALEPRERAVTLGRAEAQLALLRLELGGSLEELTEGRREVRARRDRLRELVGERLPRPAGGPWLEPAIEYPAIIGSGGFHLVRAAEAPDASGAGRGER